MPNTCHLDADWVSGNQVHWLRASLRLTHLKDWVKGWVSESVFGVGNGASSVEAWFATALDVEEVLPGACDEQLHVLVADVIKSSDAVDTCILDCALGRLGLPCWFKMVYIAYHSQVVFQGAQFLDVRGSQQLLISSHLRERDKMLLRSILCGEVWDGFLMGKAESDDVRCQFCGEQDGDGHLLLGLYLSPVVNVRGLPQLLPLMVRDRSTWPRCLLWHGWLPGLGLGGERSPWADSLGQLPVGSLETVLGGYPIDSSCFWLIFEMLRTWRLRLVTTPPCALKVAWILIL